MGSSQVSFEENQHFAEICEALERTGFCVEKTYTRKTFLHKKRIDIYSVIVNHLVKMSYSSFDSSICLQACFSCFEKGNSTISHIIECLEQICKIEYAYYGDLIIYKDKYGEIENIITDYTKVKYEYFKQKYGNILLEVSPDKFYLKRSLKQIVDRQLINE